MRTYREKKDASGQLLAEQSQYKTTETTPPTIDDNITIFARTLGDQAPVKIPVVADDFGLYGWCSDGVLEKIKSDGGAIVFGWTIWEYPKLFLTAEFHAVWRSPEGRLVDITPKPQGEREIVFVPDYSFPNDFDFDKRPRNRRHRIYQPPKLDAVAVIASMNKGQRAYEEVRASRAGLGLVEWVEKTKTPPAPLAHAIDEFLAACSAHEAKQDSFDSIFIPDAEFLRLQKRRQILLENVLVHAKRANLE